MKPVPQLTEKHTIAMTFLRKAMKQARAIFQPCEHMLTAEDVEALLQQYEETLKNEIFMLIDDLMTRDRL
jgi:hypothetical protein